MKDAATHDTPNTSAVRGLRTGKIRLSKSSASEIRRAVGVKPSEAKVATQALAIASRSAASGRFVLRAKGKTGSKGGRGSKAKKR